MGHISKPDNRDLRPVAVYYGISGTWHGIYFTFKKPPTFLTGASKIDVQRQIPAGYRAKYVGNFSAQVRATMALQLRKRGLPA